MSAFEERARDEASIRYQGDIDPETGLPLDGWGQAEAEREAFTAGARFGRTITRAEVDAARARIVGSAQHGWGPHQFVYAVLEDMGFQIED